MEHALNKPLENMTRSEANRIILEMEIRNKKEEEGNSLVYIEALCL